MISSKTTSTPRIAWISGLKGITCFAVFVHHFFVVMVPEAYYGTTERGIAWLLSSSPLGVVVNGNFFVFLFITLSAYLVAKSVLSYQGDAFRSKIGTTCVRRYFRLMLPILAYACIRQIFVSLVYRAGIIFRVPPYPSWSFVFRHSMYDTFVQSDSSITGPLWMLSDLFIGSYIVLLLSLPDRKKAWKWLFFIYPVAFLITEVRLFNFYLSASVGGILLVDLQDSWDRLLNHRKLRWLPKVFILLGLFLGGVPTHPVPEMASCYHFATKTPFLYHCRGAFFLLLGLIGESAVSRKQDSKKRLCIRFLEIRPFQYLGTISFSVFLVHDFFLTVFEVPLKEYLMTQCALSIKMTSLISLIILSVIVLVFSSLFYFGIEKQTDKLCKKIAL